MSCDKELMSNNKPDMAPKGKFCLCNVHHHSCIKLESNKNNLASLDCPFQKLNINVGPFVFYFLFCISMLVYIIEEIYFSGSKR